MTPEIAETNPWGLYSTKQLLGNIFGAGWRRPERPPVNPQPTDLGDVRKYANAWFVYESFSHVER